MRFHQGMLRYGLLLVCTLGVSFGSSLRSAMSEDDSTTAAGLLKRAIQQNRGTQPAELDELRQAAERASELLGESHYAQSLFDEAFAQTEAAPETEKATVLRSELRRIHESLTFKPTMEAKLPKGYPQPTPVHKIEIKQLPAYRMAVAKMQGKRGENGAFFELFNHIKRNDIAMTAPVELEYGPNGAEQGEQSMAFLYREPELGETGVDPVDDDVTVVDVPAMTVVSLGVRGSMNNEKVKQAEARLRDWLNNNDDYEACGELRRLGYNSPMIPSFMKYSEIQLPVCKLKNN